MHECMNGGGGGGGGRGEGVRGRRSPVLFCSTVLFATPHPLVSPITPYPRPPSTSSPALFPEATRRLAPCCTPAPSETGGQPG